MPTEQKEKKVAALKEKVARCKIAISAKYGGLNTPQMNELRKKLKNPDTEAVVVKNTLLGIAAEQAGKAAIGQILDGPTLVIFGYGDVAQPAKALHEHIVATRLPMTITGAFLDGQVLRGDEVRSLATLPSRPVLMGKVMGAMIGPLYGLSYALSYHTGALARALEARRKQLETTGNAPAAATPEAQPEAPAAPPAPTDVKPA